MNMWIHPNDVEAPINNLQELSQQLTGEIKETHYDATNPNETDNEDDNDCDEILQHHPQHQQTFARLNANRE